MKINNKTKKILIVVTLLLTLTGCQKILKDSDKKVVKNESTGQSLTANILCQPKEQTTIDLYKKDAAEKNAKYNEQLEKKEITQKTYDKNMKNIIDIEKLPICEDYKISEGGYEGIWETIFIKPLAWLIITVGKIVKNYGLSIVITTFLIRLATASFTKSTAVQSENMAKAKPELDKLEKKYKGRDDKETLMIKNQEMMIIYKKYNINVFSGCLFALIQIPLFFAFNEALNRLPIIFEETFLNFHLGTAPFTAFRSGNFHYVILPLLVLGATYYSFKLNKTASMNEDQAKQMESVMNFSIIMIGVTSFITSTGLALYWISNSVFTIIQNIIAKRRKKK